MIFNKLRKKKKLKKEARARAAAATVTITPVTTIVPESVQAPMVTPMDWRNYRIFGPRFND